MQSPFPNIVFEATIIGLVTLITFWAACQLGIQNLFAAWGIAFVSNLIASILYRKYVYKGKG